MSILETDHLILRRFKLFDARAIARIFCAPEVMCFGDEYRRTVSDFVRSRCELS